MKKRFLLPLLAGSLLAAPSLGAQEPGPSKTTGFLLGAHLNGSSMTIDDIDGDDEDETLAGGGLGLTVGYGFSSLFTLYLNVDAANIEDDGDEFTLGQADLGARLNFGGGRNRPVPYVNLALTGLSASDESVSFEGEEFEVELRGGAFTAGGGVQYFFSRALALDAGLNVSFGSFNEIEVNGFSTDAFDDIEVTTARFNVGISWHP